LAKTGKAGMKINRKGENQKGHVKGKEGVESRRTGKRKKFPSAELGWDTPRNMFCMLGF